MTGETVFKAIEMLPFAVAIRESAWLFPIIETVHVIGLVFVVGTIGLIDLRLIGAASIDRPVSEMINRVLPATWGAFAVALAAGVLMFCANAVSYAANIPFRIKVVLLILAGLNMLVFHLGAHRQVSAWNTAPKPPAGARFAGAASLTLWIAIVCAGRWIGFTLT